MNWAINENLLPDFIEGQEKEEEKQYTSHKSTLLNVKALKDFHKVIRKVSFSFLN